MIIQKVHDNGFIDVRVTRNEAVLLGQLLQFTLNNVKINDPQSTRDIANLARELIDEGSSTKPIKEMPTQDYTTTDLTNK